MRNMFAGFSALALLAVSLPVNAQQTGVYVGAHGGYSINTADMNSNTFPFALNGFNGGLFLGYGGIISPRFYSGFEGSFDFRALNYSQAFGAQTVKASLPFMGALYGRLGYMMNDSTMLYGLGGASYSQIKVTDPITNLNLSSWNAGFLTGVGVETSVTQNVFMRMQYDVDFSKYSIRTHSGKIGLGYRF